MITLPDSGTRVKVITHEVDVDTIAIFVCKTPANMLIFKAPGTGREWKISPEEVHEIVVAQIECPDCRVKHNIDRPSQRCADCERSWAQSQSAPAELCEDCGKSGAVYSPIAKRFLDLQCLAKGGYLTGLGVEARVVTQGAICRSDDVHSDRHDWKKTKSSYHCRNCKTKSFEKPKSYSA